MNEVNGVTFERTARAIRTLAGGFLADRDCIGKVRSGPLRGSLIAARDHGRPSVWTGRYERHVTREMERHMKPGMVAYDIGGHIGFMTLVLSKIVGATGSVFAFEPDPINVRILRQNCGTNRASNVTVVQAAVSDTSNRSLAFAVFDYSWVNHIAGEHEPADATVISVPSLSLDDFVYGQGHSPPHFLKVDVEGSEDSVLAGAGRLIAEHRPTIVAEVRGWHLPSITQRLNEQGYTICLLKAWDPQLGAAGGGDFLFTPGRG